MQWHALGDANWRRVLGCGASWLEVFKKCIHAPRDPSRHRLFLFPDGYHVG